MQRTVFNASIIRLLLLGGCNRMNKKDSSAPVVPKFWTLAGSPEAIVSLTLT